MSDAIKHECGIALIRLKKPLQHYIDKYGTPTYAVSKLYLLMEKQHNRGQDGAGIACIKTQLPPGRQYIYRQRSVEQKALQDIFQKVTKDFQKFRDQKPQDFLNADAVKDQVPFAAELYLGHLRYGTHGENTIENCHPMLRANNWRSRNLVVAGNFNMTNVDYLFNHLVELGQFPREIADTVTVMEKIGHFLDEEVQNQFNEFKGKYSNKEITEVLESHIDLQRVLYRSCRDFDGGYAMAALTGYGGFFVARDPAGIRPAYFYEDEEVVVVASEKPAIKTAFGIEYSQIKEIPPAHALIGDKNGNTHIRQFIDELPKKACSFERIYFSRGTDPEIYKERKQLGRLLAPQVLEAIDYDLKNTVFSYIPNTAETAFLGLMEGIEGYFLESLQNRIQDGESVPDLKEAVLSSKPRIEKLVIKDVKMRTFITDDAHRDEMVSHVYDTTYEVIEKGKDTLVVIDDSIVRGTTLEKSILTMLGRLKPKKIIIVSSAPQIRYPDCYGIDMSRIKDFIAFRAMLALLKERGQEELLDQVYERCLIAIDKGEANAKNEVKSLFNLFSDEEISGKIAQIVTPSGFVSQVQVIYQTVENLHKACPNHSGDWYFTGNYPTPGGNGVVNKAFVNFMLGKQVRAY